MNKKIILYIATSLDGFIARKNGEVDWLSPYENTEEDYGYKEFYDSINTVIVGNTTQKQFPQKYDGKTCFVFSRSSKGKDENLTFVKGDVNKFMEAYNPQGKIWLVGGASILDEFLKYDLINEFIITIIPILLGEGISLFKGKLDEKKLKLISSKKFDSGVVQVHYKRDRKS